MLMVPEQPPRVIRCPIVFDRVSLSGLCCCCLQAARAHAGDRVVEESEHDERRHIGNERIEPQELRRLVREDPMLHDLAKARASMLRHPFGV